MKCVYCGGDIVSSGDQQVCLDCGRTFSEDTENSLNSEQSGGKGGFKKLVPTGNVNFKVDVDSLLKKEMEKESAGVVISSTAPKQKTQADIEAEAKEEIKEKITNVEVLKEGLPQNQPDLESLGFDFKSFKNINIRDAGMAREVVEDIWSQTKGNVKNFSELFKNNGSEFLANFKKAVKKEKNKS